MSSVSPSASMWKWAVSSRRTSRTAAPMYAPNRIRRFHSCSAAAMIRASRPIPQATAKMRSCGVGSPAAGVQRARPRSMTRGRPWRIASRPERMPPMPTAPARTLPVPAGMTARGVVPPDERGRGFTDRPVAPDDDHERCFGRLRDCRARLLDSVRLDPRLDAEPLPDGADHGPRDPFALGRIDDPRRPRIDQDQRSGRVGRRCRHPADASARRAASCRIRGTRVDCASPTDPQSLREPGKHEQAPRSRGSIPSPPSGNVPIVSAPS